MANAEEHRIREYLLGQLTEAEEEQVELRLLTEPDFAEEYDIVVHELTDDYTAGRFEGKELEQLEHHFFKSSERRDKLKFALALKKRRSEMDSKRDRQRRFRRYLAIAASLALLAGGSFYVWRVLPNNSDLTKGLAALQSAFRDERPLEARLSDFNYAPLSNQRGGPAKVNYVQRDRASILLFNAVTEHPSAATHHALGKYYLAERQFDKAIDQFKAALELDPNNAKVHSDLGAALLEVGKTRDTTQGKGIQEFAESLRHLNRALEIDNSRLEALFNRALLYQHMMLPKQAEADLLNYLQRDPNSKWADEARQRLKSMNEQQSKTSGDEEQALRDFLNAYALADDGKAWEVISKNYTSAGNTLSNKLLDSYLELAAKGEVANAHAKLQAVAYAGHLESHRARDSYTSELVRFYSESSPAELHAVSEAREKMRQGYSLFLKSRTNEALDRYGQAKRIFEATGDGGDATFAEYRMGHCYLFQSDLFRSEAIFARLQKTCKRKNYAWLLSQCLYREASIRLTRNEHSAAIDCAHQALKLSEQIEDGTGILKILILLADEYQALNNEKQSLSFLQRGLTLARNGSGEPDQTWGVFTAIAFNLNSLGLHDAALAYQKEALELALSMNRPLIISRSYDYLALTYGSLKLYDEALKYIGFAAEAEPRLSHEPSGVEMIANSSLHAGDIFRQMGSFNKAVESYDRSIRLYDELKSPYFACSAHKGKLLSFIATGDDAATEEEFRIVFGLFDDYRLKLMDESQRNTFFDIEQSIYDLATGFSQSKKHDARRAFDYSESSHGRTLLDAIRQGAKASDRPDGTDLRMRSASSPLTSLEIQQRMPEQAQIIQYAVLENRLLIWVVSRSDIQMVEVTVGSRDLGENVREYVRRISNPSTDTNAEPDRDAKHLYDLLIKPVEPRLDKTKLLCIVPDKILHYLPFDALISSITDKFMVEDFRLESSPSSSIFVDCSERARQRSKRIEERLLSVGDPSFDQSAFPFLQRLASADREARTVKEYYKSSRLLRGKEASEAVVKTEIAKANVAHFALHYVVDERSSMLSGLVLAAGKPGTGRGKVEDGVWQIREIYELSLPQTRLVVLSACQTGIEQQFRGEGPISAARPFIAIGVPIVVATLWPVDSDSTEKLMASFHRHRTKDRFATAAALRQAQLELLHGEDQRYRRPYYWAAFTAIGGYTEF
jgi:CHAT domain-containing protein/tetratricopeptide (TPR) repeat protein